jgi:hypothetical protein
MITPWKILERVFDERVKLLPAFTRPKALLAKRGAAIAQREFAALVLRHCRDLQRGTRAGSSAQRAASADQ